MKILVYILAWLILCGALQTPALADSQGKWQGYLVDRQCADSVRNDSQPISFIQHHMKSCALMPNCQAKGYSIYTIANTNEKWIDLDKKGNELAVNLLKKSKRNNSFYVELTGIRHNKILKTLTLKEIDEPKAQ